MPITQQRMIALITSGRDFQKALEASAETVKSEFKSFQSGTITAEEALLNIYHQLSSPLIFLTNGAKSISTLEIELEHFRRYSKKNITSAARMKRQREKAGIQPQPRRQIIEVGSTIAAQVRQPSPSNAGVVTEFGTYQHLTPDAIEVIKATAATIHAEEVQRPGDTSSDDEEADIDIDISQTLDISSDDDSSNTSSDSQ